MNIFEIDGVSFDGPDGDIFTAQTFVLTVNLTPYDANSASHPCATRDYNALIHCKSALLNTPWTGDMIVKHGDIINVTGMQLYYLKSIYAVGKPESILVFRAV